MTENMAHGLRALDALATHLKAEGCLAQSRGEPCVERCALGVNLVEVLAGRVVLVPLVVVEPTVPEELWREVQLSQPDIGIKGCHKSLVTLPLVG